jgi:uncharacterized membrane protein
MDSTIPNILNFLHNESKSISDSEASAERKDETVVSESIDILINNHKALEIRKYISIHHNCKLDDIVSSTKIPKSTVTRYLKELQAQNLIKYVGSKKTGGYRVVEKNDYSEPVETR